MTSENTQKQAIYEDLPDYDQSTQYVIQLPPADMGDYIYYGVEIKEMDLTNETEQDNFGDY